MATITNHEKAALVLPTGHVVPRMGTLTVPNDTIRSADNWPLLSGRALAGQIAIEFDPEPDPSDPEVTVTPPAPAPAPPNAVLLTADPAPETKPATKAKA